LETVLTLEAVLFEDMVLLLEAMLFEDIVLLLEAVFFLEATLPLETVLFLEIALFLEGLALTTRTPPFFTVLLPAEGAPALPVSDIYSLR